MKKNPVKYIRNPLKIAHFIRPGEKTKGLPPGSLRLVDVDHLKPVSMELFTYNEQQFEENSSATLQDLVDKSSSKDVKWFNINGLHDGNLLQSVADQFNIHPLALEDITHTYQRPKLDDYGDYLYLVLKMITYNPQTREIFTEQVSILLLESTVISFQEREGDVFASIRERIRTAKGRLRKMGSDYLAYALMDVIVDTYFEILENIGEHLQKIEEELMLHPTPKTLQDIHHVKREVLYLFNSLWPLRQLLSSFQQNESKLIQKSTRFYLRDVYDHIMQVIDTIESLRDVASGMLDIYLSTVNNRMNEVMKVLTVMASIFIPLTFIAGIYGMNFDHMPELHWKYAYFFVLGIMGLMAFIMLALFRYKKWL